MNKFEKRFGRYAIPNLTTILIVCYAFGYIMQVIAPNVLNYLTLNPYLIIRGQVWRLFTWIIIPPSTGNILTTLLMLYFYWSLGTTLERTWGTYRYNVYIISGMLFTLLGSFLGMLLSYFVYGDAWVLMTQAGSLFFSTYYINMSIFLAFAVTFPNMQILLMFIIPIKIKWMGIVYGIMILYEFIQGGSIYAGNYLLDCSLFARIAIGSSLLNFVVFYLTSRRHLISPKQMHRRAEFKREVQSARKITKHKCAICGRTDESNPELEFRFCSKCNGNYEYCQEHLFTHQHVQ